VGANAGASRDPRHKARNVNASKPAEAPTRCIATREHEGVRIDIFLAAVTQLSRRAVRRLLADGTIRHNGRPIRVQSRTVTAGDVVDILQPPAEIGVGPLPKIVMPTILHQDRWIMVAAKPTGVLSASAENMQLGELAFDQQVLVAKAVADGKRPFLRLVHRLDRVTSGAILFACNPEALSPLTSAWRSGLVERVYVAIVEGSPGFERDEIDLPIARDRFHAWRFTTDPAGRQATTETRVVSRLDNGLAVIECRLVTGRTHQVRVHLASVGHPVLGDRLYGSTRAGEVQRPLLHAASISLPHPETGTRLRVVCPPPDDIAVFLGKKHVSQ
jgi:23S rRNA pseudouridine1911/1915/1917 synthase